MTPSEINARDNTVYYRCRSCGTSENLSWFGQTSCPVCSKSECLSAVSAEFQQSMEEEYE